jgi:hypothetical protein
MDPITEFSAFNGAAYSASTRRVYLSTAKKAMEMVERASESCDSYEGFLDYCATAWTMKGSPRH